MKWRIALSDTMITTVAGVVLCIILLLTLAAQAKWNERRDIDTMAKHTAKEIASEVSAVSSVSSGVRFYRVSDMFSVSLESGFVSVSYQGEKGFVVHKAPHVAGDIVRPASLGRVKKICISKAIEDCTPRLTICESGKSCCTLPPPQEACILHG